MTFARSRLALLVTILTVACVSATAAAFIVLYGVVVGGQERRLAETVQAQARMIESIGREAKLEHGVGWETEALVEVVTALEKFPGFGETGEFTFGGRDGESIVFYLRHRHADLDHPLPVPWESDRAEPMRRALKGLTGVGIAKDYRGVQVLAAYTPIANLGLGLVAKIDIAEVRRPILLAGLAVGLSTVVVVALGALLFVRVTRPVLDRLAASERRHRALFQEMGDAAAVLVPVDGGRDFVHEDVNPAALRIEGLTAAAAVGRRVSVLFPEAGANGLLEAMRRVHADGTPERLPNLPYDGACGAGWRSHALYRLTTGEIVHIWDDVTARKEAEVALQMAASVFEHAAEGILVTSPEGVIQRVNPAFTTITGYTPEEAVGRTPAILKSDHQGPEFYREMWRTLVEEGNWQGEIWNRRKNGEAYLEWLTISPVRDNSGRLTHYVSVFDDISELHEKEQRIRHQAFHDALTGLPNRALLSDRLDRAIEAARQGQGRAAVLFLDLDRFKIVNDSLGHDVGDALLQEAAQRLRQDLRRADTIARLGGDEFVVLVTQWDNPSDLGVLAEKMVLSLGRPFPVGGRELHVGASVGIAMYPTDGEEAGAILRNADTAMYAVKEGGRNGYRFFDASMNGEAMERLTLEGDLRRAIDRGELTMHYQPKFHLDSGAMAGAEALVRWHRPGQGLVSPNRFIPLAEETGLIVPLGEWVLREVCRQVAAWRRDGLDPGPVAVNVSARQLALSDFAVTVADILLEERIPPSAIDLEITETAIMRDPEQAASMLEDLAAHGIRVVLDDFGVGYSSLGYLKRLPITVLKMDRSFIHDVTDDDEAAALARGIIHLARQLSIEVVAEGVETEAQASFLRVSGCDIAQGYLLAHPMAAQDLERQFLTRAQGRVLATLSLDGAVGDK